MPDNILSIAFNLHISTKTSLELSTSQTKDAADSGSGTDTSVGVAYDISNNLGINCSTSQSKFTNISTSTTYTSLGLDYFF
jgi:hypothetical protein